MDTLFYLSLIVSNRFIVLVFSQIFSWMLLIKFIQFTPPRTDLRRKMFWGFWRQSNSCYYPPHSWRLLYIVNCVRLELNFSSFKAFCSCYKIYILPGSIFFFIKQLLPLVTPINFLSRYVKKFIAPPKDVVRATTSADFPLSGFTVKISKLASFFIILAGEHADNNNVNGKIIITAFNLVDALQKQIRFSKLNLSSFFMGNLLVKLVIPVGSPSRPPVQPPFL